jgi:hypothetical protein
MDRQFRKKMWLGIGIIISSFAIFGALIFWLAGKIESDAAKAAASQTTVVNYNRALAILVELKGKESEIESYRKRLNALLPTKNDLIEFPKFLEERSRIHQVSINFSFKGGDAVEPQENRPGSVAFSLDVTGTLERLKSFFRELESGSAKFVSALDSLDVNLSGDEYRVTAQGRAFFK